MPQNTCPRCGNPINETDSECPFCGSELDSPQISEYQQDLSLRGARAVLILTSVLVAVFCLIAIPTLRNRYQTVEYVAVGLSDDGSASQAPFDERLQSARDRKAADFALGENEFYKYGDTPSGYVNYTHSPAAY